MGTYSLRKKNEFKIGCPRKLYFENESISYWERKVWMTLPDEHNNFISTKKFKLKIKNRESKKCSCSLCKMHFISLITLIHAL